jgi:hypothetical protein
VSRAVEEAWKRRAEEAAGCSLPPNAQRRVLALVDQLRAALDKIEKMYKLEQIHQLQSMRDRRLNARLLQLLSNEHGTGDALLAQYHGDQVALVPGELIHDYPEKCGQCVNGFHPVELSDACLAAIAPDDETAGA